MTGTTAPHGNPSTGLVRNARARARYAFLFALAALFAALAWPPAIASAEPLRVIYPRSESRKDGRAIFPVEALKLALEHSGRDFRMQPSVATMQQSRSVRTLADGRDLDVLWTVTTSAREKQLRPIRIPIDLGLIGWRVLLIRNGDERRFAGVDARHRAIATEPQAQKVGGEQHQLPAVGDVGSVGG